MSDGERQDNFERLDRSGYLASVHGLAKSTCATFWWYEDAWGAPIEHNGTVCFVNTGSRLLAMTANHVLDAYVSDRGTKPAIKCQFGSVPFEPAARVISTDASLDLAVIDVSEVVVSGSGSSTHHAVRWPPEKLVEGETVVLGGYPGGMRVPGTGAVEFSFVSFIGQVTDSGPDRINISLDLKGVKWSPGPPPYPDFDLGGMSGGPIFRVRSGLVETLELAGIVYQYGPLLEVVQGRHLESVASSGLIVP